MEKGNGNLFVEIIWLECNSRSNLLFMRIDFSLEFTLNDICNSQMGRYVTFTRGERKIVPTKSFFGAH